MGKADNASSSATPSKKDKDKAKGPKVEEKVVVVESDEQIAWKGPSGYALPRLPTV